MAKSYGGPTCQIRQRFILFQSPYQNVSFFVLLVVISAFFQANSRKGWSTARSCCKNCVSNHFNNIRRWKRGLPLPCPKYRITEVVVHLRRKMAGKGRFESGLDDRLVVMPPYFSSLTSRFNPWPSRRDIHGATLRKVSHHEYASETPKFYPHFSKKGHGDYKWATLVHFFTTFSI